MKTQPSNNLIYQKGNSVTELGKTVLLLLILAALITPFVLKFYHFF